MNTVPARILAAVSALALIALALVGGVLIGTANAALRSDDAAPATNLPDRRDFLFQVTGYHTENQGGQTINLYFSYRYEEGIADADIPNYIDLRTEALTYLDGIDTSANPYWEVLAKTMCTQLKADFPIEAISCQMQVLPDDRAGLPYEPGYHGTIYTIGDIAPLNIPGPTVAG